MDMPKPTEANKKIHVFVGRWTGNEKIGPSPFDPKGGPATAIVDNRLALDGMAVVQDYEQKRDGVTSFRGLAVFRFDAADGKYHMHWFDSMATAPGDFVGTETNGVWTLSSGSPQGHARVVFDFSKPGTYTFRMEFSQNGQNWLPFMEGQYRKA